MRNVSDDARLPKVFEGLVLVTEALSSIGLACQARADAVALAANGTATESVVGGEEDLVQNMKSPDEDVGLLKPLIGQLSVVKFLRRELRYRNSVRTEQVPPSRQAFRDCARPLGRRETTVCEFETLSRALIGHPIV